MFSPKLIVAEFRIPPHSWHAGSGSPERTRSNVSAIGPRHPHEMHLTSRTLPWISTTISGDLPGRLMQAVDVLRDEQAGARLRRSSSTRARCAAFGSAVQYLHRSMRFCHERIRISGSPM